MKKCLYLVLGLILVNGLLFAQDNADEVLMTINNKPITKTEFERIYKKNNNKESIDSKSLNEYLDLFINFKLKVFEAMELGMDTSTAFKKELDGYRKQLTKPYLSDKNVDDKILQEAYDRMNYDVRASHILVNCKPDAPSKDTLAAYNKALSIRKRLLAGENFATVAKETSDDPSVKSNGGDLGYFTAFQMVYPFESAAYNTKVGDVSMPVRTKFGYHILKIVDKRKAVGQVKVAHIMVALPKDAKPEDIEKAKAKINDIYKKLKDGEDFAKLATEYSDDKGSAKQNGELPWFGIGRMVPEFEQAAFNLKKKGDYSEPIQTSFGWHIIKLVDSKGIGSLDDVKADLKSKIAKDSRAEMSRTMLIADLKKEYKYSYEKKSLEDFYTAVDTSIFNSNWKIEKAKGLNKKLFVLFGKDYDQQSFALYLSKNQGKEPVIPVNDYVNKKFSDFIDKTIIDLEESRLDIKYPEFRYLMNEYHDGILLFELTDKKVWTKAIQDTVGLEQYYEKNKNNYLWGQRVNASIYTCPKNPKIVDAVRKLADKRIKKNWTAEEMTAEINKITNNADSLKVTIEDNKYSKGDNNFVDAVKWDPGIKADSTLKDGKIVFVYINSLVEPTPKSLSEAKGLVTADYQSALEKEWIATLRAKYKVTVNQDVLSKIK